MVIEKTKVRIRATGEIKDIQQIRLDSQDIIIKKGTKKYIYGFEDFNYIPCYGVLKDKNGWEIYHRDIVTFDYNGVTITGVFYWNAPISTWQIFDQDQTPYNPQEISNIEIVGNEMNPNWQNWR